MPQPKHKDWLNGCKNKTHVCTVYETHFRSRDTCKVKVRGWEKVFQVYKGVPFVENFCVYAQQ